MTDIAMQAKTKTTAPAAKLTPNMLNHVAWVTHDAEATVRFYTEIMGMEFVSTVIDDRVPSTGDAFPYFHIFFRMGDGSTMAFFECPGLPARGKPSHPAYEIFDHIALEASDPAEVHRWVEWLRKNGIEVIGPNDHDGLILSIYFHDPNGIRLEITTPLDPDWNNHKDQAYQDLDRWVKAKNAARQAGRDVAAAMIDLTREVRAERQVRLAQAKRSKP